MAATLLTARLAASKQVLSFSQLIPPCSLDPKLLSKRCGFCAVAAQQLRSPQLVALEYAELNLPHNPFEVAFMIEQNQIIPGILLVKRAECWAKEIGFDNIHFLFANATISFQHLMSTYPGPLVLVSLLCPDPHFKKRHHKRRVVHKPLVAIIVSSFALGGKMSHVLEHVESIDPSILCDGDGGLVNNPMGIRTEREIHEDLEGARIYRRMYQK